MRTMTLLPPVQVVQRVCLRFRAVLRDSNAEGSLGRDCIYNRGPLVNG